MQTRSRFVASLVSLVLTAWASAAASETHTPVPDGRWHYALGAGLSYSSGNTDTSTLTLTGDGTRATDLDKLHLSARTLRATNNGVVKADQLALAGQYARELSGAWFGFGQLNFLRDRLANVAERYDVHLGAGYHVLHSDAHQLDAFAGVGRRNDNYMAAAMVAGIDRTTYSATEAVLGEESHHKLTGTTVAHQRLEYYPNLTDRGERRVVFDSGVAVAITRALSLTASFVVRYNSDPGENYRRRDALLVTGLQYKIE